jgi:hypothetical protein
MSAGKSTGATSPDFCDRKIDNQSSGVPVFPRENSFAFG